MAYFVTIKIALRFHLSCAMRRNPSAPLLRRQANDREAVGSAEGFGAAEHPKARSKAHAPRQGRRFAAKSKSICAFRPRLSCFPLLCCLKAGLVAFKSGQKVGVWRFFSRAGGGIKKRSNLIIGS